VLEISYQQEQDCSAGSSMKRRIWFAACLAVVVALTLPPSATQASPVAGAQPDLVAAEQARLTCLQFLQVRLGGEAAPISIETRPVPHRDQQWLVDGNVKGPEGPLLFACHLQQGARWELLNFSLWAAPMPPA
jgi:hypothetical protein